MSPSHPLLLLRHGETRWNLEGRYQGATDTRLSSAGEITARNQAELIAQLCQDGMFDKDALTIVASPLSRATDTAAIIAESLSPRPDIRTDPRLREISFGRWEGMTSPEVKVAHYEERKSRKQSYWAFAPEGGESMASALPRVTEALSECASNTIIVAHSAMLRVVLHLLSSTPAETAARTTIPHNGGLLWDGTGITLAERDGPPVAFP